MAKVRAIEIKTATTQAFLKLLLTAHVPASYWPKLDVAKDKIRE